MNTVAELWSEPGVGKSHTAHAGWPNPLHLDTAFTSLGFRQIEVEPDPSERGETWPIVLKLHDYDEQEALRHYEYVSEWPDYREFDASEYDTIIIDNAADMRVLAAKEWCEQNNTDWPKQAEWSNVNDMIDEMLRVLRRDFHVVVVAQMKAEYQDGDKTGNRVRESFKRMEYRADFQVELTIDDENQRHSTVHKNRHIDPASDSYGSKGSDLGPSWGLDELLLQSEVPTDAY